MWKQCQMTENYVGLQEGQQAQRRVILPGALHATARFMGQYGGRKFSATRSHVASDATRPACVTSGQARMLQPAEALRPVSGEFYSIVCNRMK